MKKYAWEIITRKSFIHFKAKYLQISNISGQFLKFRGEVMAEPSFINPEIRLIVDANSVETSDATWNARLKGESVLSTVIHPFLVFTSTGGCRQSSGKIWELTGELVVKSIRNPITLVVNLSYIREDIRKPAALFHLFGTISRKSFGLACEEEEEIGDEVLLNVEIYLTRKSSGQSASL